MCGAMIHHALHQLTCTASLAPSGPNPGMVGQMGALMLGCSGMLLLLLLCRGDLPPRPETPTTFSPLRSSQRLTHSHQCGEAASQKTSEKQVSCL